MTKNPKNDPCPNKTSSEGNFGTGLFVGVIVGALGMFLFGTDRGQDLITDLKRELEKELARENQSGKSPLEQARTLIAQVVTETQNGVVPTRDTKDHAEQKATVDNGDELFPKFQRKH